ncbi:MAG: hypothetical protein QOE58_2891 [Actinomycetota bacterium]|nr:hypothetical protein [Actinomycetota bacterium]
MGWERLPALVRTRRGCGAVVVRVPALAGTRRLSVEGFGYVLGLLEGVLLA